MNLVNHQFRLAARPVGVPKRSDWDYIEEPVHEPDAGELLVKALYISLDPAMRGWMNDGKSYVAPIGIGEVMRAGGVGRVIASENPSFAVGDQVFHLSDKRVDFFFRRVRLYYEQLFVDSHSSSSGKPWARRL